MCLKLETIKNNELSEQARKARSKYQSEYKKQNHEKINAYHKKWRAENKDKVKKNNLRYWERKALKDVTDNLNVTDKRNISVTCLNCGEPFTAKRKDAKYCSGSCRVANNRKLKTTI